MKYLDKGFKKYTNILIELFLKLFLKFLLVFIFLFRNKEEFMRLYVNINNKITQSKNKKYPPEDVIIILPCCMQSIKCIHRITQNVANCKKCGMCQIGEILEMSQKLGVKLFVATGGTAARNIIKANKPKFVLSVACERDLSSGIADIKNIPVIGILNQRINGPCIDTIVNIELLKEKLHAFVTYPQLEEAKK